MYGAIIGDMVGSPYEFDQGRKVKDFRPLFINRSVFTEAFYGIPIELIDECLHRVTDDIKEVIKRFDDLVRPRAKA